MGITNAAAGQAVDRLVEMGLIERTEVQIQNGMDTLLKGRTSFIIAHRLSTIRDADWILVMKDGDIVEQGKHARLLAKDGFYAELINSQFMGKAI